MDERTDEGTAKKTDADKRQFLEGFLLLFQETVEEMNGGGERFTGKGDAPRGDRASALAEKMRKYLSLKFAFDPFHEKEGEISRAYQEIQESLSPALLKEVASQGGKMAEALLSAEEERFRLNFQTMVAYLVAYGGENKAEETFKRFYRTYLLRAEQEKIEKFARRDTLFEEGISTGFSTLDEVLEGGLYPGLYVLGAPSSAGKTSFCAQLADQIARKKQSVLFFSLEMSEEELYSKSLSRLTFSEGAGKLGKSERRLTGNKFRKDFSEADWDNLARATAEYLREIAPHKKVVESVGEYGVAEIARDVRNFIALFEERPVVFVDYLQILRPYAQNLTDKQNTDRNVSALKRLCRDEKIVLVAISSFNRSSYHQVAGMDAFKESGAIEYSADVVLTLQAEGMKEASETDKKSLAENKKLLSAVKRMPERPMILSILKNRRGRSGEEVRFSYRPVAGMFFEEGLKEETKEKKVL